MPHPWYKNVALSLLVPCVLHGCITAVPVLHQAPARNATGAHVLYSWMPSTATSRAGSSFPLLLPDLARVLSSHFTADIAALHRRCSLGSRLRV